MWTEDTREQIERRAIEIATEIDRHQVKLNAEIVRGVEPRWHIVVVQPGRAGRALDELSQRGFGVYDPILDQNVRGKVRIQREKMFHGYLLVFVWDIETHWDRILACTGVSRVLAHSDGRPAVLSDRYLRTIQSAEFRQWLSVHVKPTRPNKRKRILSGSNDVFTLKPKAYLDRVETLAPEERIGALHRALGLA